MEDSPQRAVQGLGSFPWYVGGTQVLGLACVVITGVWMGSYHGGYAWDGSGQEFNVHPLCMVLGLVFLYGDGIVAVFDFHNHNKIPNMYSLHSWCGMLTFVLFSVQWLMGLGFFLFPGTLMALRSWYLPLHVFFGLAMLAMSLATCLLGISEKLFFSIQHTYSQFAPEGILGNMLGLLLVAFGILVGYVVTREDFRRPPHPEEEALSVHFKTLTEGRGSPTSP
ncbi:transmembrane ascorbate-dependent reductase CYB561 isoform X2 [Oncorhynchus masou masou]|uniref:transmembrane ascorbate-dependent reductase CYB561 isoform X2 n=1 Tax=Oncorhynchus masou masou TaxID=90313 RepID=UPI0031836D94